MDGLSILSLLLLLFILKNCHSTSSAHWNITANQTSGKHWAGDLWASSGRFWAPKLTFRPLKMLICMKACTGNNDDNKNQKVTDECAFIKKEKWPTASVTLSAGALRRRRETLKVTDSSSTQKHWKWQTAVCHFHLGAKAMPRRRHNNFVNTWVLPTLYFVTPLILSLRDGWRGGMRGAIAINIIISN